MTVAFKFRGLIAPVFTPFHQDRSLNLGAIPSYVGYLKRAGVGGVLIHGTTGEGVCMSVGERRRAAEEWVRCAGREGMHVMVQVGGGALPHVTELAEHAERLGADSILTLPELFFKPSTSSELVDYLEIVGKAAPKTPLLYYHFPAMTNVNVNMCEVVREAQERVQTFRGAKMTTPNLQESLEVLGACKGDTTLFIGSDVLLLSASVMGLTSSIGTTFNMFHRDAQAIVQQGEKGDKEAADTQRHLNRLVYTITKHGAWVPTMKAAMNILSGVDLGPVRPPSKSLTPQQVQQMKTELGELLAHSK